MSSSVSNGPEDQESLLQKQFPAQEKENNAKSWIIHAVQWKERKIVVVAGIQKLEKSYHQLCVFNLLRDTFWLCIRSTIKRHYNTYNLTFHIADENLALKMFISFRYHEICFSAIIEVGIYCKLYTFLIHFLKAFWCMTLHWAPQDGYSG